jgi:hypothetical protein
VAVGPDHVSRENHPIPSPHLSPRGRGFTHTSVNACGISLEDRAVGQRSPPPSRGRVRVGVKTGAVFPLPKSFPTRGDEL